MSVPITIITYDIDEEDLVYDTVIKAYEGTISSSSFTNYENGTVICPNGLTMKVDHIEVSESVSDAIGSQDLGKDDGIPYTVTELKDTAGGSIFDTYTLIEPSTDILIPASTTDFLMYKMENYMGIGNSHWNPIIVIRTQNYSGVKNPPMTIEIYSVAETLLESIDISSNWSSADTTTIPHQICFIKINYTTDTRNSFVLKVD